MKYFTSTKPVIVILCFVLFLISKASFAQPGTVDNTFLIGSGANAPVYQIHSYPDGKVLIVGAFTTINGYPANRIARLNADGTLDSSFYSNFLSNAGANSAINSLTIQPDGKILLGGIFWQFNGVNVNRLARINYDGTVDTSFSTISGPNNSVLDICTDGTKIIVTGTFTTFDGQTVPNYVALQPNGQIDTTFFLPTISNQLNGLRTEFDSGGKIYLYGSMTPYPGTGWRKIVRLNNSGTIDNSYNNTLAMSSGLPSGFVIQPDGKQILAATVSGSMGNRKLARYNLDGTIDSSFMTNISNSIVIFSLALDLSGKVIVAGWEAISGLPAIMRLNSDGSTDNTFQVLTSISSFLSVAIQKDGKILAAPNSPGSIGGTPTNRLTRLNGDTCTSAPAAVIQQLSQPQPCSKDSIELAIHPVGEANKWYWFKDSCNTQPIDSGFSVKVKPIKTTSYYVKYISDCIQNCSSKDVFMIDKNISVDTLTNGNFVLSSTHNTATAQYQWLDCLNGNQPIPGETASTFAPSYTSEYAVHITDTVCSDTSICKYAYVSGVNVLENEKPRYSISPNPASDFIQIQMSTSHLEFDVHIFDLTGKEVFSSTYEDTSIESVDISNLKSGVYVLKISFGSWQFHQQIIKI